MHEGGRRRIRLVVRQRAVVAGACAAACLALVSGCGGSDDSTTNRSATDTAAHPASRGAGSDGTGNTGTGSGRKPGKSGSGASPKAAEPPSPKSGSSEDQTLPARDQTPSGGSGGKKTGEDSETGESAMTHSASSPSAPAEVRPQANTHSEGSPPSPTKAAPPQGSGSH